MLDEMDFLSDPSTLSATNSDINIHVNMANMSLRNDSGSMSAVPRRRNGRPQACEPCHRRKVACDHALPVCSRCKRGTISDKCVYITNRSVHAKTKAILKNPLQTPPQEHLSYQSPVQSHHPSRATSQVSSPKDGLHEAKIGFMGATSFSAVLQEAQDKLQSMHGSTCPPEFIIHKSHRNQYPEPQKPSDVAINILMNLPDKETSYHLFHRTTKLRDAWCRLAIERLLDSLWQTFGDVLESENRDPELLRAMATKLCYNSTIIMNETHTDPEEWFKEFSGDKFRWESIGILYHAWTDSLLSDAGFRAPESCVSLLGRDRMEIILCYKNSAWNCVQFCWSNSSGNTLLAFLLYRHGTIETHIGGDTDIRPWRLHGDCVSLASYLGLHSSPSPFLDKSISIQIKRRLFAGIFYLDKVDATFAGRPPMMSARFSSTPLPLDIDDEELMRMPPYHNGNSSTFDAHGWNTDGKFRAATLLRARTMLAFIRDPILELSLRSPEEGCEDTLLNLRRREMDEVANFPPIITYKPEDMRPEISKDVIYGRLIVQLEHVQNLFFIERLLSKLPTCDPLKLLQVSLDLIGLSLVPWVDQSLTDGWICQAEWMILYYGGPAAGVVCLELLRPSSASLRPDGVKRSAMIQQLSMLVGALDWVAPTAPNQDLCASIKHVVKQVLDRVLDPPQNTTTAPAGFDAFGMDVSADMNDLFNFDLLDTFDWLRP